MINPDLNPNGREMVNNSLFGCCLNRRVLSKSEKWRKLQCAMCFNSSSGRKNCKGNSWEYSVWVNEFNRGKTSIKRRTTSWNSKIICDARNHLQSLRYRCGRQACESTRICRSRKHPNRLSTFYFASWIAYEKTVRTMGSAFARSRTKTTSHANSCRIYETV